MLNLFFLSKIQRQNLDELVVYVLVLCTSRPNKLRDERTRYLWKTICSLCVYQTGSISVSTSKLYHEQSAMEDGFKVNMT